MQACFNPYHVQAVRLVVVLLGGMLMFTGWAQAQLSDKASVSLITLHPGEAIYALWGHSALRIRDPERGMDIVYNYGTFEFGSPLSFVARFAYGKLDYSLARQHYPSLVAFVRQVQWRTVVEQHLSLTAAQKDTLFRFLENNALPENRTYRYDFLFDNCATRIRDLFTQVLGIPLPAEAASDSTYRDLLRPYATRQSFLHLGINLGMGMPVDAAASDRSFLPLELVRVVGAMRSGGRSLVARTESVNVAAPRAQSEFSWAAGLAWLALSFGLGISFLGSVRLTRVFDRVCYTIVGCGGLLIAFLWLVSLHTVSDSNLNLLWMWPAHAVVIWWPSGALWLRVYHGIASVLAGAFLLVLPLIPQGIPGAALPLIALIALRSGLFACDRYVVDLLKEARLRVATWR